MSPRTYLSIGDVLSLLREDFPDVTISKIRFLESQGLVNPERSPSGYRKFFEQDVERLRWVLRQQREHFLPLKVIRDRLMQLADGDPVPEDLAAVDVIQGDASIIEETASSDLLGMPEGPIDRATESSHGVPGGGRLGTGSHTNGAGSAGPPTTNAPARNEAGHVPRLLDRPSNATPPRNQSSGKVPTVEPMLFAGRRSELIEQEEMRAGTRLAGTTSPQDRPSPSLQSGPITTRNAGSRLSSPAANDKPAVDPGEEIGVDKSRSGQGPTSRSLGASSADASRANALSGASLTAGELASACGLSVEVIMGLETAGMLVSMLVAGTAYFDEDALVVARLVAGMGKFGIEPRHLRLYRNAVDREVGLVEQVIAPLLRQRNPESRQRAVDSAEEIVNLGESLRAALLRQEFRRQFGV